MTTSRRSRRIAGLGAVALLLATLNVPLSPVAAAAAAASLQMTIDDVAPNSPALINSPPQPLRISMTLTNTTNQPLRDITISAARGNPIANQQALDAEIAKPTAPSDTLVAPLSTKATATLAPFATKKLIFQTTTDATDADVCLCADAIYPLYFTADYPGSNGVVTRLAVAQTYIPSFTTTPAKMRVGWLWPLLDRPHRLANDRVFTDDALAGEVAAGGRLDQLLQVVEKVATKVPMTLVTDPDLIDELAVMSSAGGYRVNAAGKPSVAGSGAEVAAAWLQRLRAVLAAHPKLELDLTAFADPAVESLTRNDLSWSSELSAAMQARVTDALGVDPTNLADIAWPANGAVGSSTLATLVSTGTKTVVISDRTMPGRSTSKVIPDALAPVPTRAGKLVAAITSSPIERRVNAVLSPSGKGLAALPNLVAELALRVATSRARSHYLLITPSRVLTVVPAIAVRAIEATSVASWATPLALRAATASITPADHGRLRSAPAPNLPAATLRSLQYVSGSLPGLGSLYANGRVGSAAAQIALARYRPAMQRIESTSLLLADPQQSALDAERLERQIKVGIRAKVHLAAPQNGGKYTITSKNSQLPITIVNQLPQYVQIRLDVTSAVPGLRSDPVSPRQAIAPNSKVQVRVPTHVDRVGRIVVSVNLSTPDGLALGDPIQLTVRSTALGAVGVVITIIAAVVLALALLVRFVRRTVRRSPRKPPRTPDRAPAATAAP